MKLLKLKQFAVCLLSTALSISCTEELSIEVQDWITLPDEEIELNIKFNSKTVTISSKGGWTATSDVDWLVIEPSKGSAGETEVTITSTLEENKEATGTISFNSSQAGNLKEEQLAINFNYVQPTAISDTDIELSIKNGATTTITTLFEWKIESYPEWLTITPLQGSGTTELLIESLRYDFNAAGEIVIVDEVQKKITINVSQIKYFDGKFAQTLQKKGYIRDASKIDLDIIKEIEYLELENGLLTNLTGLCFFKSLTALGCGDNQLTSLDVSENTSLTSLKCYYNKLTSLDVSKNTSLTYLNCSHNQLTSLDVSENTNLTSLMCYYNQLTSLDVSKNTSLSLLWCNNNQITSLDVSKNTSLGLLDCYYNKLTSLDVSKNTSLTVLRCYNNPGNGNKFPVKAWFDNYNIPSTLTIDNKSWDYYGSTITIDFYK